MTVVSFPSLACCFEGCNKSYSCEANLMVHIRQIHIYGDSLQYICGENNCLQTFTTPQALKRHVNNCHCLLTYRCYWINCGKVFKTLASFTSHQRFHSGNVFNCPVCKKEFGSRYDVKRHIRCHTGERPYRCQSCARTFAQQHHLVSHQFVHTRGTRHIPLPIVNTELPSSELDQTNVRTVNISSSSDTCDYPERPASVTSSNVASLTSPRQKTSHPMENMTSVLLDHAPNFCVSLPSQDASCSSTSLNHAYSMLPQHVPLTSAAPYDVMSPLYAPYASPYSERSFDVWLNDAFHPPSP